MKKRFIIPLIIIFSVILSICVSAQPSQADTPLENSESYTDVSVQESANQLYESLMSAFNSANGKNSSTPSQLSYPDAYGGAYINDSGKLVIYVVESKIEDSSDIDSTIEDISNFSPADNVLDSTTADYVLEPCEYSYTDLNNIIKTNYPVTPRQKRSRCRSNRGIIDSPTPLFTPFCRFRYRSRGQIHSHQYPRTSSTNDPFLKWFSYASRMMRIAMSTSPF